MSASIQEVKKFWDDRPCNIRHSAKEIGSKEYFDEVEKKKFFVEPHIPAFSNFPQWSGKKVMEIGCGIGTAAINFARNGADYTGVELSEESLNLTKKRFEAYGQKGKFYSGNAEELSSFVPVEPYDLIYSFGVIHHSPYPEKIIGEIKKFMNKDSVLKIMLYAKESWKNYMIEAGLDQPEAQFGCPIAFTYTEQEVADLLQGFTITEIKKDHIFPYRIEEYKRNEFVKQPWFEEMPDTMFKTLEKNLGWHMLITAKLK
jgi:SAM-dependent methyltransferase